MLTSLVFFCSFVFIVQANKENSSPNEELINGASFKLDTLISPYPLDPLFAYSTRYSDDKCSEGTAVESRSHLLNACFFDYEKNNFYSYSCKNFLYKNFLSRIVIVFLVLLGSPDGLIKTLYSDEHCHKFVSHTMVGSSSCFDGVKATCEFKSNPYQMIPSNWLVNV